MAKKKFSKHFLRSMAKGSSNPKVLDKLSRHPDPRVREHVAYNSNAHPDTLRGLYKRKDSYWNVEVLLGLAHNSKTPTDVLQQLEKDNCTDIADSAWETRRRLVISKGLRKNEQMKESKADELIHAVLNEVKFSDKFLKQMAYSSRNPSVLSKLGRHRDRKLATIATDTACIIARDPAMSDEALLKLANHRDRDVRNAAQHTLANKRK